MIYLLLNNSYHLKWIDRFLPFLYKKEFRLIMVPVSLTDEEIKKSYLSIPSLQIKDLVLNPFKGKVQEICKAVQSFIDVEESDTLFVLTENNLTNIIVINHFHRRSAKIVLLEDGTLTATCFTGERKKGKGIYSFFLNILTDRFKVFNDLLIESNRKSIIYSLPDQWYNYFVQSQNYDIYREIKSYMALEAYNEGIGLIQKECVLFSQNLYALYVSKTKYIEALYEAITALSSSFERIHLKLHPQELDNRLLFTPILNRFENVKLADTDEWKYAKYSASFCSTALLENRSRGVYPIYLYQLHRTLLPENVNKQFDELLEKENYIFLESYDLLDQYLENNNNWIINNINTGKPIFSESLI